MNTILFEAHDIDGDHRLRLSDRRWQQIRDVHRAGLGDQVRLGEINGLLGTGIITRLDDSGVELRVELDTPPPPKLPLTLLLALPRPKMLRRVVRSCSELGVAKLILLNTSKVEKSYWQTPALAAEKLRQYLIDGLQQACDTVLPEIELARLFKPFVEDTLPALTASRRALVAHPRSETPCPIAATTTDNQPSLLAIGPEGGFTDYEVGKLVAAGCQAIHLGPRILRVENALTTLVSKLFA